MSDKIYHFKREVENFKDELQDAELDLHEADKKDILAKLYDQNLIDYYGKPV